MKKIQQPPAILNWAALILGIIAFFISIYSLFPLVHDDLTDEMRDLRKSEKLTLEYENNESLDKNIKELFDINQWVRKGENKENKIDSYTINNPQMAVLNLSEEISDALKDVVHCVNVGDCNKEYFMLSSTYSLPLCDAYYSEYTNANALYNLFNKEAEFQYNKEFSAIDDLATWREFERICERDPYDESFEHEKYYLILEAAWLERKTHLGNG